MKKHLRIYTIYDEEELKLLHTVCSVVEDIKPNVFNSMKNYIVDNNGYGLAAPQIGLLQNFFVFKKDRDLIVCINPSLEVIDDTKISIQEGCFSCANVHKEFPRYKKIAVTFTSEKGYKKTMELTGLPSIVFQHELDHLKGRLIID